ncbi:hypothetical protein [Arenibaculum pallidiluteum]|uniref:hypothetical protein n=1 Tax=Arenibaculum pallidiluteum TaxID=2812559 RepID=UPI001A96B380|nr:hypothetical protein [Arenibaculum pallidiluteum]
MRATYRGGVFNQDPRITEGTLRSFQEEEQVMIAAGLLKGRVDYGRWVDKRLIDAVHAEAGPPQ